MSGMITSEISPSMCSGSPRACSSASSGRAALSTRYPALASTRSSSARTLSSSSHSSSVSPPRKPSASGASIGVATGLGALTTGRKTLKDVPTPSSEETRTWPPDCATDAVDRRQAEARALAHGLGREERLEDVRGASARSMPMPVSVTLRQT